jgi:hypothetical protein
MVLAPIPLARFVNPTTRCQIDFANLVGVASICVFGEEQHRTVYVHIT